MRFFIECTHTYETNLNTGIQRVVRCIVNETLKEPGGRSVQLIGCVDGDFRTLKGSISKPSHIRGEVKDGDMVSEYMSSVVKMSRAVLRKSYGVFQNLTTKIIPYPPFVAFIKAPYTKPGLSRILHSTFKLVVKRKEKIPDYYGEVVKPDSNDVLVLLDSSWHIDLWDKVMDWKKEGVRIIAVIYDLIPLTHASFVVDDLKYSYDRWMYAAAINGDAFICISRTVGEDLRRFVGNISDRNEPCVSHFVLGCELDNVQTNDIELVRGDVIRVFDESASLYIYVSTIEPRKNHAYALDAFDILWDEREDARFVIIGRIGWDCDAFVERVSFHPEYGKKLFMFNDLSDVELDYFYQNSNGLVFTSFVEGFGLPIVEALQNGVPVFASDIPVFREIGSKGIHFVDLDDPASLAGALRQHHQSGAQRLPEPIRWPSWKDSAMDFWRAVDLCLIEGSPGKDTLSVPQFGSSELGAGRTRTGLT